MELILYILVCFVMQFNFSPVNAEDKERSFGYYCVDENSDFELPSKELRKACDKIPVESDLEVDEYKIGPITCSRVYYGVPGPCGENKVFIQRYHENNPCGVCVCNENGPRKLLYHPPTNKCYYIYEQGFCPENSLIVFNQKTKKLVCKRNPCHSDKIYQVRFKSKCVELYTRAKECKIGEFLGFDWNDPDPKCTKPYPKRYDDGNFFAESESEEDILPGGQGTLTKFPGGGGGIFHFSQSPDQCPSGQQLSLSGRCAGSWEW